jgi:hypothetical protein
MTLRYKRSTDFAAGPQDLLPPTLMAGQVLPGLTPVAGFAEIGRCEQFYTDADA